MITKNLFAVGIATVAMFVAGCGAMGKGKTVMTQGANSEPVMGTAPETGTYRLYTSMSPNPTTTVKLNEGDALGFRKSPDGNFEGVAGDSVQPLGKGTAQAYWKLEK